MTIKGKRAKITNDGLGIIMSSALERPRKPRTVVANELQKELDRKGHDVPELEVLERKISWFRTHDTDRPLDKPWSLSTLSKYELSPEAVPLVLAISHNKQFNPKQDLTIREAQWIARLYVLVPEEKRKDIIALTATLERWAEEYALKDQLTELSGKDPPSNRLESMENWVYLMSGVMREMRATMEENRKKRENLPSSIDSGDKSNDTGIPPDVAQRIEREMKEEYERIKREEKEAQNER